MTDLSKSIEVSQPALLMATSYDVWLLLIYTYKYVYVYIFLYFFFSFFYIFFYIFLYIFYIFFIYIFFSHFNTEQINIVGDG